MIAVTENHNQSIIIPAANLNLNGILFVPHAPIGIVIFAHGSGSGRLSPRNEWLANELHQMQFATLLFDLLSEDEEKIDEFTREFRFNIPLLAERLRQATAWVQHEKTLSQLPLGYFGASTGAGAAILAAKGNTAIKAIVSRGGRPDLAGNLALQQITAATLLIVGGLDEVVIQLNKESFAQLHCEKELATIEGATHLFEEPGKLVEVAKLTIAWFKKHLK